MLKAFEKELHYTLSNLSLPDQNLNEKFNYFIDYFKYYNGFLGSIPLVEVESHLSLLKKIEFQLQNNKPAQAKQYVDNYLKYSLFKKDDFLLSNYFTAEYKIIRNYRQGLKDLKYLKHDIKNLIKSFEKSLFSNTIESFYNYLSNGKKLNIQKAHCKYLAKIIVSELHLIGYTSESIAEVFKDLMKNYGLYEDGMPWSNFSFEEKIENFFNLNRKGKLSNDLLARKLDDYFKNITFKDRIYSLNRFYSSKEGIFTFLFRIENFRAKENFIYRFKKVIFYDCKTFNTKYVHRINEYNKHFFDNEFNTMIAEVKVKAQNQDMGIYKAIHDVTEALNYVNFNINNGHGILNLHNYIPFLKDEKDVMFVNSVYGINYSHDMRFDYLNNNNLNYIFRKKIKSKTVSRLINSSRIYFLAFNTWNLELKMLNFWMYLEALTSPFKGKLTELLKVNKKKETKNEGQLITEFFSRILTSDEIFETKLQWYYYIYNIIINAHNQPNSPLKISYGKSVELTNPKLDLNKVKKETNNAFFNDLIKGYEEYDKKENLQKAKEYYFRQLIELYEMRNMIVHNGNVNHQALVKMNYAIQPIIYRIHKVMTDELKRKTNHNLKSLFRTLLSRYIL